MNWSKTFSIIFLAGWSGFISVESWFRPHGPSNPYLFPEAINLDGARLHKFKTEVKETTLPTEVSIRDSADYRTPDGKSYLFLKWITLSSSGTGIFFPIEKVSESILGPQGRGYCQVLSPKDLPPTLIKSAEGYQSMIGKRKPSEMHLIQWLLGLKPLMAHGCLWIGRTGQGSRQGSMQAIDLPLKRMQR